MATLFDLFHDEFFKSMLDQDWDGRGRYQSMRCPQCGYTYQEFHEKGTFGCAHCYDTFRSEIRSLLHRIHGSSQYEGKVPKEMGDMMVKKHRIKQLRYQLEQAIHAENFEQAMLLRDEIKELEKALEG